MSNTSITNLQITDTFQVWINKTNEIIDLANENVMLAGSGAGFTVTGNSTLDGIFTANELNSTSGRIDDLSVINLTRAVDADEEILSVSPIRINSNVENIFTLKTTTGNRPILSLINGGNATWEVGHSTTSASSPLTIRLSGAVTPQATLTQTGRFTVAELQGNGALITNLSVAAIPNLDANKITSGQFNSDRIPSLNANKITSGTIANAILPASATRGEISVSNLTSTSSSEQGFITGRRFRAALTFDNIANKPTTFPPSAHTHVAADIVDGTFVDARLPTNIVRNTRRLVGGSGITISGNGDLSADRTISIRIATQAEAEIGTNNTNAMTPLRTRQAIREQLVFARHAGNVVFGQIVAGSSLTLSGALSNASAVDTPVSDGPSPSLRSIAFNAGSSGTLSGSWVCLGRISPTASATGYNNPQASASAATLWQRV